MGFSVFDMPPETFAQANPFLTGYAAGQQLQSTAEQIRQQQLQNQALAQQVPYAGAMTQAQLAYSQAQTPNLNAQTQYMQSGQLPLAQAQSGLTNAQIPFAGYQALGQYYGGIGRMNANLPTIQLLNQAGNNPYVQQAIQNNPQYAQDVQNAAAITAQRGGSAGMPAPNMPNSAQVLGIPPGAPANTAPAQTPQSAAMQSAYGKTFLNGAPLPAANSNMALPPPVPTLNPGTTPQDINNTQNLAGSLLASKTMTPQQIQAITYENSAQNMFKQMLPTIPAIANYAGIAGKTQLQADRLKAALGLPTSPAYTSYLNYEHVAGLTANEIRRSFQGQATDQESKMMDQLINPVSFDITPKQATGMWQQLFDSMHANTQAITQSKATNIAQAKNTQSLQVPNSSSSGRISVISPSGQRGTISASNLQAAMQAGYKQAGA